MGTTRKKIVLNSKIKKNSPPVHNKIAPALQGPRLAAGAVFRQAGQSLQGRSVVWLRQSAAHNWPVTSTQQNSIHAQGRKAPSPWGIYKYLPDSFRLLQKQLRKLTADYLQTVSWDMVKAEVGWLGGGVCGGTVATAVQRVPGWALSPGSRLRKALDSATGKGV